MPQPTATITNVAQAHEVIKEMNLNGYEWGADYRSHGRAALKVILEGQLTHDIDSCQGKGFEVTLIPDHLGSLGGKRESEVGNSVSN